MNEDRSCEETRKIVQVSEMLRFMILKKNADTVFW